ncbi:ATP synthase subunit epsilon [Cladobotryum mycophilum]|uniref:ATP synthase subunit epsilon n=1 Tax=Cladobotryum mycophilum TaxID=491253 RepID=A0ABR0SXY4_9HYPO
MTAAWKAAGLTYNRYLAIAARTVRRSLKEEQRLVAEKRAVSELRFVKWQNGKAGEVKDLNSANLAAMSESASS